MSLSIGIVGMPNVGKSTLFTALTNKGGLAANYPFATIEPNVGVVPVPDARLDALAAIDHPARIVPATVEFVDIAGLVAGASQGEGLGNQFLANIRETDAICEVVRFFSDPDVVHVAGKVDPQSDVETIKTELILADMATIEKAIPRPEKEAKRDKAGAAKLAAAKKVLEGLNEGHRARTLEPFRGRDRRHLRAAPADDEAHALHRQRRRGPARRRPARDRRLHAGAGLGEGGGRPGRARSRGGQGVPGGDGPSRRAASLAWCARRTACWGCRATSPAARPRRAPGRSRSAPRSPQAAGVIHTDFERGFIKAETASYEDYVALGGEKGCRDAGKLRQEGKEYVVQDGDVMHCQVQRVGSGLVFRFGVLAPCEERWRNRLVAPNNAFFGFLSQKMRYLGLEAPSAARWGMWSRDALELSIFGIGLNRCFYSKMDGASF